MVRHFEKELEKLKATLIKMGSAAEEAVGLSITALLERDAALAKKVIDGDEVINSLEIKIDNAIIDLLALQQPVAIDLRFILAAQKINNDLERIGDHGVNIAESVLALSGIDEKESLLELPHMASVAKSMLRNALDGFVHQDFVLGKAVLQEDDVIDDLNRKMVEKVIHLMKLHPKAIETGLELIRVSRNLERIADLSTNIAEEVIFIAQARVVKHHAEGKQT
jgi:phosphate transport system protein